MDRPSQLALTLRLVGGLTTPEVARAFLVSESTMAARITRAKKKIATARIPYRVPSVEDLPERIAAVLAVVHLIFTTGHSAPSGRELVRVDLIDRAIDLARMLRVLVPQEREVTGLLALMVLTDARRSTRLSDSGELVLLADQNRDAWDRRLIAEGVDLVHDRTARIGATRAVRAAGGHLRRPRRGTDLGRHRLGRDRRPVRHPRTTLALARGGAEPGCGPRLLARARGRSAGTRTIGGRTQARVLSVPRCGPRRLPGPPRPTSEARLAYQEALLLTENEVERAFLTARLADLAPR